MPRHHVTRYPDGTAFLARAEAFLLGDEATNNLILGIADTLRREPPDTPPYLTTVEQERDVVGCMIRTPPLKLVVTQLPEASLDAACGDVADRFDALPAVLGPEPAAGALARRWSERHGVSATLGMSQGLYALERVVGPTRTPPGQLRWARSEDRDRLIEWAEAFTAETGIKPTDARAWAAGAIERGDAALWVDGEPRAMAAISGYTPNGARVGYVYTPPELRGRGYASVVTARLSQAVLDGGRRYCFLYTDLGNPTSNAIYQRIGYRRVGTAADWVFTG